MGLTYEYRAISFFGGVAFDSAATIEGLNVLGQEGWLLVSPLHDSIGDTWLGVFARVIESPK